MIDEKKLIERISGTPALDKVLNGLIAIINAQPKIGEWIPCSECLPQEYEKVLVWYEYFRYGDYNKMYQTYGVGYQADGFWSGDVSGQRSKCIAWQPLPEPYIQ